MQTNITKISIALSVLILLSVIPIAPFVNQADASSQQVLEILVYPKGHQAKGNDLFGAFTTTIWYENTDTRNSSLIQSINQKDSRNRTWDDVILITDTEALGFTHQKLNRLLQEMRGSENYPLLSEKGFQRLFYSNIPNLRDYDYYIYYPSYSEHAREVQLTAYPNELTAPELLRQKIVDLLAEGYIPIANLDDLNSIRSDKTRMFAYRTPWQMEATGGLHRKYVQVANINATPTAHWNSWAGFLPLGDGSNNQQRFTGIYDGLGFTISNLSINRPKTTTIGLFGYTDKATIRNVQLENTSIIGSSFLGALVGYAVNTIIETSSVSGIVEGKDANGGWIGGLVGISQNSKISNCYSIARVTVPDTIMTAGGLVGRNTLNSAITTSYAAGSVRGKNASGLVGSNAGIVTHSFYDSQVTGKNDNIGKGIPLTTQQLKTQSTYDQWQFRNEFTQGIWYFAEGFNYPRLSQPN